MKHYDKVEELMRAFPGRPWTARKIIRYVDPSAGCLQRAAIKTSVHRVLSELHRQGLIDIVKPLKNGGPGLYTWKP